MIILLKTRFDSSHFRPSRLGEAQVAIVPRSCEGDGPGVNIVVLCPRKRDCLNHIYIAWQINMSNESASSAIWNAVL